MNAGKVVVTAALTGAATTRQECPYIPYTPAEIAEEARRSCEAGAAVVHIHGREDDGSPSFRVEVFEEIGERTRSACGVLLNYSTGAIGLDVSQRLGHVERVRPEIAALNMGSMNYAIYSRQHRKFHHDWVFANPFRDIIQFLEAFNAAGVRAELECFDAGHVANTGPLIDMGLLKPPLQFSLILGVTGGIPSHTAQLVHLERMLPPGSIWEVIGVRLDQWRLVAAALSMGGNVRVGLEDNFYLARGKMATSNAELVEKVVRMIRDVGLEPATPAEARTLLQLRGASGGAPGE